MAGVSASPLARRLHHRGRPRLPALRRERGPAVVRVPGVPLPQRRRGRAGPALVQAHSSCGVAAGAVGCGSDVGLLPYLRRPGAAMNRDKRIEIAEEVYACIQGRAFLYWARVARASTRTAAINRNAARVPQMTFCDRSETRICVHTPSICRMTWCTRSPRSQNRRARTELRLGSRDHADNGECRRRHC